MLHEVYDKIVWHEFVRWANHKFVLEIELGYLFEKKVYSLNLVNHEYSTTFFINFTTFIIPLLETSWLILLLLSIILSFFQKKFNVISVANLFQCCSLCFVDWIVHLQFLWTYCCNILYPLDTWVDLQPFLEFFSQIIHL
jgi:hypothetical protein